MGRPVFIIILISCCLVSTASQAQFLPLNAVGRCEVADVIIAEGFSRATLYHNEAKWLKGLTHLDGKLSAIEKDSLRGRISADFEMMVYAQSGILKKPAGSVSYHFLVESKDGKYRYLFSDFVFHFYAQDRNYQFVKAGKTKPLEESEAAGWHKLWTDHRKNIYARVTNQVDELKLKMAEAVKEVGTKAEEKKVEW